MSAALGPLTISHRHIVDVRGPVYESIRMCVCPFSSKSWTTISENYHRAGRVDDFPKVKSSIATTNPLLNLAVSILRQDPKFIQVS